MSCSYFIYDIILIMNADIFIESFNNENFDTRNTAIAFISSDSNSRNKKLKNMYYTGQLTVPGPGVPPSIISGEVVAKEIIREHLKN